jgi:hypothetical protein
LEERNNPLKPQRGEKYIGSETGTIYEWDGEKWVVIDGKATSVGAEDA